MKILVALDLSAASHVALAGVANRPWPAGSYFEVLSVIQPSHVPSQPEALHGVVQRVEGLIGRAVERLRARGWEATGGALADHDPKTVILDRAKSLHADFVVIGSHERSAASRVPLGSVGPQVLRHAPCSVEIVRAGSRAQEDAPVTRILLATDGSECSNLAAGSLAARPWRSETEIRILSVPEVRLSARQALMEMPFLASAIESARNDGITHSKQALEAAARILNRDASSELGELSDDPRKAILNEADKWRADLIVMGSHGLRGMDRIQMGSVSEAVALHAACSVEVIREKMS